MTQGYWAVGWSKSTIEYVVDPGGSLMADSQKVLRDYVAFAVALLVMVGVFALTTPVPG